MCKPPLRIEPDFFENSFIMTNMKGRLKESLEEIEMLKKEIQELKEEIKIISLINKECRMKFK
jgi:regulator of replication initiation timing